MSDPAVILAKLDHIKACAEVWEGSKVRAILWPVDAIRRLALEWDGKASALAVLLALLLPRLACAQTLTGPARVIDGDTLEVQGQRVRLHGVDAPEKDQLCRLKGSAYHCGLVSLVALEELLDGQPVTCEPKGRDRYGRVVARCFVGQPRHFDLSGLMVRQGLAVAYTKYSRDYAPLETLARAEGVR